MVRGPRAAVQCARAGRPRSSIAPVFVATTLLYPCVLAALCLGAGLLIDRVCGGFLAAPLLLSVGAAGLIAMSQLLTYLPALAPVTPFAFALVALAGFALGWARARTLAAGLRTRLWLPVAAVLAYLLALAPVLAAGRPTFSSFMALSDSAVHMLGADYLLHHGQHYGALDLHNSPGRFISSYYASGYPSGADTLFGASAFLLGLPLIWAFQPFNAFMLAAGCGPAWLLARRMRLRGALAAAAALTAVVPALVYAYVLIGSVKEIVSLTMILTLGCLVATHRRWLGGQARRAIPFALVFAAGVSALGVAFDAWGLAAVAVLAVVLVEGLRSRRLSVRAVVGQIAAAVLALVVAAWPTWAHLSTSIRVAQNIATTGNAGNLTTPLRAVQVLGVWLRGSYKLEPAGTAMTATHVLIVVVALAAIAGAVYVLTLRAYALAGWIALTLLASLIVTRTVSTWGDAKALVLTSPLALLLAWGGVAALADARVRVPWRAAAAALLAVVLVGAVLASDALLYHTSNLAPTARYEELASIDSRFAGRGPTLFTDFDEYSMYVLRDLDVGGPDFVYPPPVLASVAGGYGQLVDLERASPAALRAYPLIVTRRDPLASRPPSAYRLLWQGSYYQVWGRVPGAPAAGAHVALSGTPAQRCAQIAAVADRAVGAQKLVASRSPTVVAAALAGASRPARWGHERRALAMSTPGTLSAKLELPAGGEWDVWLKGQFMPKVTVGVDGRRLATVSGQLSGNSLVFGAPPPSRVRLSAGTHTVTVTRSGFTLAPGEGGAAVLDAVVLTPARQSARLMTVSPDAWRSLCGGDYQWVETVPSIGA
jgi:hypothetical protein